MRRVATLLKRANRSLQTFYIGFSRPIQVVGTTITGWPPAIAYDQDLDASAHEAEVTGLLAGSTGPAQRKSGLSFGSEAGGIALCRQPAVV